MLSAIYAGALAQSASPSARQIGSAVVVVGHASLLPASQRSGPLTDGAAIVQGDTIETGADGYVYITTVDQGFISLRPNSSLTFERYEYDPGAPVRTVIKLLLHRGVVREISGKGAQAARDHYRMNTPVAALGVRGTDFSVFTDSTVTRADVRSGGIVMTPLAEGCSAAGTGPCEGSASAELFAFQRDALLQLDRGSARPVIVNARLSPLAPDQAVPALKSEDNAARAAAAPTPTDPGVAPSQLTFPLTPPAAPPAPPPSPPVAPAPPAQPEAQQIFWGRFAPLAGLPANTTLDTLLQSGSELVGAFSPYAITRSPQPDMVMPASGKFSFGLQNSEAYVVNAANGTARAATINNALLSIDFGAHTFATSLDLSADGSTYAISGRGGIGRDGKLFSDFTSPAGILGAVAGKDATQAGYVFTQSLDSKNAAVGATQWSR